MSVARRRAWLWLFGRGYEVLARPLIFRASAQVTHERLAVTLRWADAVPGLAAGLAWLRRAARAPTPVHVGGVRLDGPLMVAAGLVKGDGFASEEEALAAVAAGRNVMPGWRSVPALMGAVEFGSFTRLPRVGNPGVVVWRDVATRSTQNRVGLRNPGARAAAAFLARHAGELPACYGVNVAVSPGVTAAADQARDVAEAIAAFTTAGLRPSWFTVNLSCPNTDDDPGSHQTEEGARTVLGAALRTLATAGSEAIPLWVKLGPDLAADQYRALMAVFHDLGVRAVVATNTVARPAPDGSGAVAGVGGGALHAAALAAAAALRREAPRHPPAGAVDVIGCGGVLDGAGLDDFARLGVGACQLWSALVYRGPLAIAAIEHEASRSARERAPIGPAAPQEDA